MKAWISLFCPFSVLLEQPERGERSPATAMLTRACVRPLCPWGQRPGECPGWVCLGGRGASHGAGVCRAWALLSPGGYTSGKKRAPALGSPRLQGSWWGRGQHTWKDPEDGGGRFPEGRVRMVYLLCELPAHTLFTILRHTKKCIFFPDLTKK